MPVRQSHLDALKPYLIGEHPRDNGEIDMRCPLHEDSKRSASLNVKTGEWVCFATCGGGKVSSLIRQKSDWVEPAVATTNGNGHHRSNGSASEKITDAQISGWAAALQSNSDKSLDWMVGSRGLRAPVLEDHLIGWDHSRKVYTIPVFDASSNLVGLRRYNPSPAEGRRKMWGVTGMNAPHLYPIQHLDANPIIICGGEWDALATIQAGFPTITRTAAERVWNGEWSKMFAGKTVYVCHDADATGRSANRKVHRALDKIADVRILNLPYPIEQKHGKDLSDFWLQYRPRDFENLIAAATDEAAPPIAHEPEVITVLDSFDSRRVAEPVRLMVTIKGKREPGYSVPARATLRCSQDAGRQCQFCPMMAADGEATIRVEPESPAVLEMIDATAPQVTDTMRRLYGAQKCNRLETEVSEYQAVETLFARPSIEHVHGEVGDYKNLKLVSVGRHNTIPNNTIEALGALYPNPRSQSNEFLAWGVTPLETTIDKFEMSPEIHERLSVFQPAAGERPLRKMGHIARELANVVTKIYGRSEMHVAMDLTFHSAIGFRFRDEVVYRGWLDTLIIGDTRTGKSEAAKALSNHYAAGEMINCEAASLAGVVGGLQQFGSGREWAVTWGAIPLNDRRLVILDEVSGLTPDMISQMSDVRSAGIAKLTKIQQEVTLARTRLLWLGNPRKAQMSDYTFGVQAIPPLIGNPEDIARFDMACAVSLGDVSAFEINRPHAAHDTAYDSEACKEMLRWAWSRKMEDITWTEGAEQSVYDAALALGSRYVEDPPLIQAANARIKIARIAVAMAIRLFSTEDGETVIVRRDHVRDAVAFLDRIYQMPTMGYAARSGDRLKNTAMAETFRGWARTYISGRPGLVGFLRGTGSFRRQDIEEVLDMPKELANSTINDLYEHGMIRKVKGDLLVEPTLHDILRKYKEDE